MGLSVNLRTADQHSSPDTSRIPRRTNVCLITNNVNLLVEFYELILGCKAQRAGEDDTEFHTGLGVLAIFPEAAQGKIRPRLRRPREEPERDTGVRDCRFR